MKHLLYALLVAGLMVGTAQAGTILLVSDQNWKDNRSGTTPDLPEDDFVAFLQGLGHTVIGDVTAGQAYNDSNGGPAQAQADLNSAADTNKMIVFSRVANSGDYAADPAGWNGITYPILQMNAYLLRSNRWKWADSTGIDQGAFADLAAHDEPTHAFVAGRGTSWTQFPSGGSVSTINTSDVGNGLLISHKPDDDLAIVEWDAGTEFYSGSGQTPAAQRAYVAGIPYHETHGGTDVVFDHFTANGKAILAQTINTMIPEPATLALLGLGLGAMLVRRRK